uniref:Alternative protein ITLN2 n=1 Tax=Homo sapiens TaxID=9606 RepID=L8E943_HUMAN|nr:alternative protein ITLN2 [Homo sapiens]
MTMAQPYLWSMTLVMLRRLHLITHRMVNGNLLQDSFSSGCLITREQPTPFVLG